MDANSDQRKDPYNPVDAICAAARYLRAAGGDQDLRTAIFAYNHADWYVDEVLLYANQYGKLPEALVGSLTGLTEGAHFPVAADARYADDIGDREALAATTPRTTPGNAADVIPTDPSRRSINIYSQPGAPVVAVNDGTIKAMGENAKLGTFIVLGDVYGNTYTYSELGSLARLHPVAKEHDLGAGDFKLTTPKADAAPDSPASAGENSTDRRLAAKAAKDAAPAAAASRSTPRSSASASSPSPRARRTPSAPGSPASSTPCSASGSRAMRPSSPPSATPSSSTPRPWSCARSRSDPM